MLSESTDLLRDEPPTPGIYGEQASLDLLERTGIPVVSRIQACSIEECLAAADQLGYPVVLKLADPELVHKSDIGAVWTGLVDQAAVRQAHEHLIALSDERSVAARFLVAQELEGLELLVGVKRDPHLGAVLVLGAGGTLVELLDDVALGMAPLSAEGARELIRRTKIGRLLEGHRGAAHRDVDALGELVVQVSELALRWPGLRELDLNPVIVGADFALPVDARMVIGDEPKQRPPRAPLPHQLLSPRSIAVVGASNDAAKPGSRLITYLQRHGYEGRIVPVNARGGLVAGLPAVTSVADLDEPVDLACLAVRGSAVPEVLISCAERGIPSAIVFSAGFAEAGSEGEENQRRLGQTDKEINGRLRYCGPNSIGVISPNDHVFASFSGALEAPRVVGGSIAFLSQSGAIGSALVSRAWEQGVGFSRWVSTGNEHDLDIADYVSYLAEDPQTDAVLMFLEAIRDGDAFRAAALRCIREGKSLLAYKTGRSLIGQQSVVSHTGAIAGDDDVYDAFLRSCGVVRVNSLQGLVDGGLVATRTRRVHGRRVAIITMSGGAASVMADRCADLELELPPLPTSLKKRLAGLIPGYGSVHNPIDVTVDAVRRPEMLTETVKLLLAADEFDLVLCQLTTNADPSAAVIAKSLLEAADTSTTPLIIGRQGADSLAPNGMQIYRDVGYPVFDSPERVVEAAAVLADRWEVERQITR